MTLKQGSKVKFDTAKDLQTTISRKLFSHSKPLRPMIREILGLFVVPPSPQFDIKYVTWWTFCFQNKAKITLRQAFLAISILCKSDIASCNILSLEHINDFQAICYGGHVVF